MVKSGSGQDQAIDQSHGDTDRNARRQRAQHAASGGSMNVKHVCNATIGGGNYDRLTIRDEAYMADKSLIQDVVDDFALIERAFRQTLQCGSFGSNKCSHSVMSYSLILRFKPEPGFTSTPFG